MAAVGTNQVGSLYAVALALVLFFLTWAVVAARPWSATAADPRLKALAAREAQLRREAKLVNRVVAHRWAVYRAALHAREAEIAAAKARNAQVATSYTAAPVCRGAHRHAATPDDHEDVVIERRTLPRDGNRDRAARRGGRRGRRTRCRRERVPPARGSAVALSRGLRALAAEPRRLDRCRPRPAARRRARAGSARANGRALRSDRARRGRRCRLRPHLHGRRRPTALRPEHAVPAGGAVRVAGNRIELDQASASISAGSARDTPPSAPPSRSRRRGRVSSTRAATSPRVAAAGPSASRRATHAHARADRRARSRPPAATGALAARWPRAAPPDRSRHGRRLPRPT